MASIRAVTSSARVRKAIAESGSPVESIDAGRPSEQASWTSNSLATARVPATSISSGLRSGTSIRSTPYSLCHGRNPRAGQGVHAKNRHRLVLPLDDCRFRKGPRAVDAPAATGPLIQAP